MRDVRAYTSTVVVLFIVLLTVLDHPVARILAACVLALAATILGMALEASARDREDTDRAEP